jgi:hypothetical protein
MEDLCAIPWSKDLCMTSFDVSNMYTNIPTNQLAGIINMLCLHNNISPQQRIELLQICDVVLSQNYFTFLSFTYIQKTGLAMGAPTSSVFSEIYLQYLEHTQLFNILLRHHILGYFRYVDDILIVYDTSATNIQTVLDQFNDVSKPLSFTMEMEKDECINFLDISIYKQERMFKFGIYGKPTATDVIIPSDSNHPIEHKLSAIRFLANRIHTYPVTNMNKIQEWHIMHQILQANHYHPTVMHRIQHMMQTQKQTTKPHTALQMTPNASQD